MSWMIVHVLSVVVEQINNKVVCVDVIVKDKNMRDIIGIYLCLGDI